MEDWSVPALKVSPLIFHLDSHCTHSSTVQISLTCLCVSIAYAALQWRKHFLTWQMYCQGLCLSTAQAVCWLIWLL